MDNVQLLLELPVDQNSVENYVQECVIALLGSVLFWIIFNEAQLVLNNSSVEIFHK